MSSELQKRIITSSVLISLLIIFNFSKFFIIGLFIAVLFICVEFSELLAKIVGPGLKKNSKSIISVEEINYRYLILQLIVIFYVLFIFGGTSITLHSKTGNPIFFLFILSICFFSDIGGYVLGRTIGGKKLTKISPNKTISGCIGSFSFSLLSLIIFYNFDKYEYPFSITNIFFCLVISLVCQLGDLFISYLKRKAKIKDTGVILPGHGGLLDRVDGLLLAVPFSYILLKLI